MNNLHRKLDFVRCSCYMHCCWQHVSMLLGTVSFDLHVPSQGQPCSPAITILTFLDILSTTLHYNLLHSFFFQSWWLFFCCCSSLREAVHSSAYLYVWFNNNRLKSCSLKLVISACIYLASHWKYLFLCPWYC